MWLCDLLKTIICNTALKWAGQGTRQAQNYCLMSNCCGVCTVPESIAEH